ncbi:MAG: hypothetical protein ACJ763_08865 [Bdellovibrionia bacterium]
MKKQLLSLHSLHLFHFFHFLMMLALVFSSVGAQAANKTASSSPQVIQSAPAGGTAVSSSEDWKGKPEASEWAFSALTGLGIVNATPGFAIMGAAARKILDQGFVPDINNSVWIETELGPVFAKGSAAFQFSGHLRWDFVRNEDWTFYALGGFGGSVTGQKLGDKFEFYPRFGAGALWKIFADFNVRGEVSHELVVLGAQFEF